MYEQNLKPLPPGDTTRAFADVLSAMQRDCNCTPPDLLTPQSVVQWGKTEMQPYLAKISRRLLLPGSRIVGLQHLAALAAKAEEGRACIVCLNHNCNLDVPTLYALLEDEDALRFFHRIVWVAGRKLQEDPGMAQVLVQAFNRVTVTPRSWLSHEHSDEEIHIAHQINIAAHRAIHDLRHQRWIFALFPTGTRIRPDDPSTTQAIDETDSYLKTFEFMAMGHIEGCTLPVSRDHDMAHETPTLDRMCYTIGAVQRTDEWRERATERFPELDQRAATARAIMQDIASLAGGDHD